MTDQPGSLAEALAAFQSELPPITKDTTAKLKGETKDGRSFEYSYAYANLAAVSAAIMPLMGKLGLSFTAAPTTTAKDDGYRFVLAYNLLHVSGEKIEGVYPLPDPERTKAQTVGSAITYARRYCLCAVTGVAPDDDDDDGQAASAQSPPAATRKPREKLPPRPVDELPRNADGQISRKYTTDEEKAAAGIMTKEQQAIHNALERDVKGTDSEGRTREPQDVQHATGTAPDDPWYDPPPRPPAVRQPRAAVSKAQQIVMHFERLGVDDKSVRLGYTARLAGLISIRSTNDLTAQQGIDVEKKLASCKDADAFDKLIADLYGIPHD